MNTQETVKLQLGFWHGALGGIMSDCGDALNKAVPGATINSIASVYAHIVWSEDTIINGMMQGKPTIFSSGGWEEKTGTRFPGDQPSLGDWAKTFKMDYPKFKEYADVVFANTDTYLAGVSDSDLQQKTQTPIGEQTKGWFLAAVLATHLPQHTGEIAALKGVQGLKGLPF